MGIFNQKEFRDYFLYSTDQQIFVLGMRLFMTVADHKDFKLLEDFLGDCDEWQLRVFNICSRIVVSTCYSIFIGII